jgi:hypothetical protein
LPTEVPRLFDPNQLLRLPARRFPLRNSDARRTISFAI